MSLGDRLAVERVSDDVYVSTPGAAGFLFGGCSLGLALTAATETVQSQMMPKSLHACFLRPGDWGSEITLEVERWSEGRSFATRQVMLRQDDRSIASVVASFHVPGESGDWQSSQSTGAPAPELLVPARVYLPEEVIDVRPVNGVSGDPLHHSWHPYWARPTDPIGADKLVHGAALAFMSDYMVILSMFEAGAVVPPTATIRTVTHTIWFHREIDADAWLLFGSDPSSVTGGRGFALGTVYSRSSALVATFAQEVIVQA